MLMIVVRSKESDERGDLNQVGKKSTSTVTNLLLHPLSLNEKVL